jgi:hypothetical protein
MKKSFFKLLFATLAVCLLLSGCSDFDEMKSQRLLIQAEVLIQQGSELQAEQALADLVAKYPETQSGIVASKRLMLIQKQRERREREAFAKVLDSYRQVLNGYQALYAEYPRSIADLDQSDYFFDSAYLEEITPDSYQAYLWLKSDGSGYRIWCVTPELERGYAVEASSRSLVPFERDALVKKIKARFQAMAWDGKLVALLEDN